MEMWKHNKVKRVQLDLKSLLNQSRHTCDFTINNQSYPEGGTNMNQQEAFSLTIHTTNQFS